MDYLAIEIRGDVHILNDLDELGGLIDNDIPHTHTSQRVQIQLIACSNL